MPLGRQVYKDIYKVQPCHWDDRVITGTSVLPYLHSRSERTLPRVLRACCNTALMVFWLSCNKQSLLQHCPNGVSAKLQQVDTDIVMLQT